VFIDEPKENYLFSQLCCSCCCCAVAVVVAVDVVKVHKDT
jgi:hypothetical protein